MKLRSSIRTRLTVAAVLLVAATVGLMVWRWSALQGRLVRNEKRTDALAYAVTMANVLMNELDDENWSQVRVDAELAVANEPDLVYLIVHDSARRDHRIVAAVPADLVEQYIPDVVAVAVSRAAIGASKPVTQDGYLLRDVTLGGKVHMHEGEPLAEVAVPILNSSRKEIGTLRVAISLRAVDQAVAAAVRAAALIGGLALLLAVIAALIVARALTRPLRRLATDVSRIAAGDFAHRATVDRHDEVGALADAFNEMTVELERSFGDLQRTVEKLRQTSSTFERFVPRKFLAVVAREGIENIQVGTSQSRRMAVLFSDIRGYTQVCEGLEPHENFVMLNDYIGRMGRAIDRAGGFVDKYIGDAVMALFDQTHTDSLLDAILAMREELRLLNAERAARGLVPIEHGIGAHVGMVEMGTLGFASKIESTVIGDSVNVASRVEGVTKERGLAVLVTAEIVAGLRDPASYWLRKLPEPVTVRGRREPVVLYTLVEDAEAIAAQSMRLAAIKD